MKTELNKLNEMLGEVPEVFICMASYEDRCLSVAQQLDISNLKYAIVLWNSDYSNSIKDNLFKLESKFGEKVKKSELRTDAPLFVADKLREEVISIIKETAGLCLVDITTFTHEQLLILIKLLAELAPEKKIKLTYTGAGDYSINFEGTEKWLSRGVAQIRTVLGYPGIMFPSKKLHLIVLVGFESERAEQLIINSEPALVSLGLGRKHQSVAPQHYEVNAAFHEGVKHFTEEISNQFDSVRQFQFSCLDPLQTMKDIFKEIEDTDGYNVVICPLNTKPSTIGAALAAFKSEQIQLVYVQPIEYNTDGYSTSSDSCSIFDFTELLSLIK